MTTSMKKLYDKITFLIIFYKKEKRKFCGNSKTSIHTNNQLLYLTLIAKDLGAMLKFNGI